MTNREKVLEIERKKQAKEAAMKSMAEVLKLPSGSSERWRAAYLHFLKQRPEAQEQAVAITKYNNEVRLKMDRLGRTKHSRRILSSPQFLLPVLQATDPDYFIRGNDKRLGSTEHIKKMKKAFPEFFLPEEV